MSKFSMWFIHSDHAFDLCGKRGGYLLVIFPTIKASYNLNNSHKFVCLYYNFKKLT